MPSLWLADALSRPEINRKEKQLPRKIRCKLVQLWSCYSIFLNSYRSRMDPDVKDQCPECSGSPHDVAHLFNCPMRPTNLGVECLWLHPRKTSEFLGLIQFLMALNQMITCDGYNNIFNIQTTYYKFISQLQHLPYALSALRNWKIELFQHTKVEQLE